MLGEQDWRLEARLRGNAVGRASARHGHSDAAKLADHVRTAVAPDVVVTHDGPVLFAYGASHASIEAARESIEAVLAGDGPPAAVSVSHWDDALGDWRQVDPPLSGALERTEDVAARGAATVETRTMVCIAGKPVRAQIEQTMLQAAGLLGVECEIAEHNRLLTTQVSFTVTGPRGKLDRFRADLVAQGWATIRADALTLNPAV
jgi:hypothetical protein